MQEKVILVNLNINQLNNEEMIEELKNLCLACNMDILESISQNSKTINKRSYIGKGKLDEIKIIVEELEAEALVFNDELSPSQIAYIQDYVDIIVYDRPYIILEIFRRRAKTKEAVLQVEIARLQYMLPRLVGMHSNLSRQRGGGGNVHRGRGGGETKLELDRRHISDKIAILNKELKNLKQERSLQRKRRQKNKLPSVALVGYTNSGKSSILNSLLQYSNHIKKEVLEKDMLFATLETSSRLIKLINKHEFIITDTIGFVHNLPHHLIEAFKSTLEEIKEASLILHIIDSSNNSYLEQIQTTNDVLKQIGVKNIPVIYVFNKCDKLDNEFFIPPYFEEALLTSAKDNINIDKLLATIEESLFASDIITTFNIPYSEGKILNLLNKESSVKNMFFLENTIEITTQINPKLYLKLKKYET